MLKYSISLCEWLHSNFMNTFTTHLLQPPPPSPCCVKKVWYMYTRTAVFFLANIWLKSNTKKLHPDQVLSKWAGTRQSSSNSCVRCQKPPLRWVTTTAVASLRMIPSSSSDLLMTSTTLGLASSSARPFRPCGTGVQIRSLQLL